MKSIKVGTFYYNYMCPVDDQSKIINGNFAQSAQAD